jgi:hypothetical protein
MNRATVVITGFALALGAGLVQRVMLPRGDSTLLFVSLIWLSVVQGATALVAATDLVEAKWLRPLRATLLSLYPLQLMFVPVFIVLCADFGAYPWHDEPSRWMNSLFVGLRVVVSLVLATWAAHYFARSVERNRASRGRNAVLYLVSFAVTQFFVGMDWVMSLEYPWISHLFPLMFVVESFVFGIAMTVLLSAIKVRQGHSVAMKVTLRDSTTFLLGMVLFSGGMWFVHHLTIWYANIPEEVVVLLRRYENPFTFALTVYSALTGVVVPGLLLLMRRARIVPEIAICAAILYLSAVLALRLVYFLPVSGVSGVASVVVGLLFALPVVLLSVCFASSLPDGRTVAVVDVK